MDYEKRWIGGHNGHWEIYTNGKFVTSCDDNELETTLKELSNTTE